MTDVDLLQCVLHTVEQPLRQPPHGVVGEVHDLQRDVASGEDLRGEQLPADILLAELLDVVAEGKDWEVATKYDVVTVDPRGVDLVEGTLTGQVDS